MLCLAVRRGWSTRAGRPARARRWSTWDPTGASPRCARSSASKQFAALPPGMTEEELLREIGPPSERQTARNATTILSYRYPTSLCQWYQITIGPDHRMQGGTIANDPRCDPNKNH